MTKKLPKHHPDYKVPQTRTEVRKKSRRKGLVFIISGFLVLVPSLAFAAQIILNSVEKGAGVVTFADCDFGTEVNFTYKLDSSGVTRIDTISVPGISSGCDGKFFALALKNSSGTVLDEIVWQLTLTPGDTSITAVANGVGTTGANSSAGLVSTVYPRSQNSPEGSQSIDTTTLTATSLSLLRTDRSATN